MPTFVLLNLFLIGTFWTAAYLLIIYRSHKDKMYGMPAIACFGNVAWEAYYIFVAQWNSVSLIINSVWLALDLIILAQVFIYAPKEFPWIKKSSLYSLFTICIVIAFSITHYAHIHELIVISSAFALTFLMSILFIVMLLKRRNTKGQSLYIAASKGLGTFFVVILFHFVQKAYTDNHLLHAIYIAIISLDLLYFGLLYYFLRLEGKSPWRHI